MLKRRILKLAVAAITVASAMGLTSLTAASIAVAATTAHVKSAHAKPAALSDHRPVLALPPGARPAPPPSPAARPRFLHVAVPNDTISCYFNQAIGSLASNKWVSAELGYSGGDKGMLRARATAIGPWENFDLCYDSTANYWFIVSDANGLAVSTELGYRGGDQFMLRARATAVGPWEKYVLACTGSNTLIIGSLASNKWTSTEMGYTGGDQFMLRARATAVGPWEQYVTTAFAC